MFEYIWPFEGRRNLSATIPYINLRSFKQNQPGYRDFNQSPFQLILVKTDVFKTARSTYNLANLKSKKGD